MVLVVKGGMISKNTNYKTNSTMALNFRFNGNHCSVMILFKDMFYDYDVIILGFYLGYKMVWTLDQVS